MSVHPRNESPTEKGGMGVSLLPWSSGGDAEVESYDKKPGNRNKGCNLDDNRVSAFISGPWKRPCFCERMSLLSGNTLKYLGVKGHHVCNLLSDGSGKNMISK